MRIISQNNTLSVDFEGNIFRCEDGYVYVHIDGSDRCIGKYSSSNIADEVFKDMHESYISEMRNLPYVTVYQMPKE